MTRHVEIPAGIQPAAGQRALWRIEGHSVALFNVDGVLFALEDRCPHAGSSLVTGLVEGRSVQCRAHGLRFDLATGCMRGANGLRVRTYAIEIRDGRTFLQLEEQGGLERACAT
jgi:3-phenylpropionate/trans-cinnamate dioxygenase ferredoxin component